MTSEQSADQVWHTTVWRLESGFFARDVELAAAMQAQQLSTRIVPSIHEATQFFRVRVDVPDPAAFTGEVWVIFLRPPGHAAALARAGQLPDMTAHLDELRPRLLAALPEAKFCFATDDREGYAHLGDPEATPIAFAAAVAVVKYYAAWDESNPIVIATDLNQFAVSVEFNASHYLATVRSV